MSTPLARFTSHAVGWLADRRIPGPLRAPVFKLYARATGADLSEMRLRLADHPSLSAFFVRRLREGARPFPQEGDVLASPVDGTVQHVGEIQAGELLQAKGRPYPLSELLAGAELDLAGDAPQFDGGTAWTIYLGPRDYHRIHAPIAGSLEAVHWVPGARYSVHPRVLSKRARVLSINERAVLTYRTAAGPLFLVAVGALNVGRIRVVGVPHGAPAVSPPARFAAGDELARFEMGSTVVLVAPAGVATRASELAPEVKLQLGQPIGRLQPC